MTNASMTRARAGRAALAAVSALALTLPAAPADARDRGARRGCSGADARPAAASLYALRRTTLCLVNAERARRGLRPLRLDRRLDRIAGRHARDMVRRGYFGHSTPEGRGLRDRVRGSSYGRGRHWAVGETLAWACGERARPAAVVASWMRSRGHRRVLLSRRYRHLGLGVVRRTPRHGGPPGATYVAELGRR